MENRIAAAARDAAWVNAKNAAPAAAGQAAGQRSRMCPIELEKQHARGEIRTPTACKALGF